MRCWIIRTLLCTLLLLPFSGMQSALATHIPPASSETQSSEQSHCDAVMSQKAAPTVDETTHVSEASCCDEGEHSMCATDCPADCGHCLASGAQSGFAAGPELKQLALQADGKPLSIVSFYSHQPLLPVPPPDIN